MPSRDKTPKHIKLDERKPVTFSLPCIRRLYQYLGEYDALVELTELAARSFIHDAQESGDVAAYVTRHSQQHNVMVHVSNFSKFGTHLARSYIVTVAAAAGRLLQEYRREHVELFGREWTGDSQEATRLDVTLKNVAQSEEDAIHFVGADLIDRFHYYRLVRNWTCHEKADSKIDVLMKQLRDLAGLSEGNADLTSCDAPNEPEKLTFDDFVLFTRVVKKIAERLNTLATPDYQRLIDRFPLQRFKKTSTKPARLRNAVCGHLRTEYGLDQPSAEEIRDQILVQ